MTGNNEIRLCKNDMMEAIQYWLNTVYLKPECHVRVTNIERENSAQDRFILSTTKLPVIDDDIP